MWTFLLHSLGVEGGKKALGVPPSRPGGKKFAPSDWELVGQSPSRTFLAALLTLSPWRAPSPGETVLAAHRGGPRRPDACGLGRAR
jgi:hypothetical protein